MAVHFRHAATILKLLKKRYPHSNIALNFHNPLELLVATILSAQCTDKRVNIVTAPLFKKYKAVSDYAKAKITTFEKEIRSTGFYRNKAKNIIAAAKKIRDDFGGRVPEAMDSLLKLPGVARKTANIVLYDGYGRIEGIAVDTHVRRLSERLHLSQSRNPEKVEQDLMKIVPRKSWGELNHLLIQHGREVCQAQKPQCLVCILKNICPSKKTFYPVKRRLSRQNKA